jgi:hypothetical protein
VITHSVVSDDKKPRHHESGIAHVTFRSRLPNDQMTDAKAREYIEGRSVCKSLSCSASGNMSQSAAGGSSAPTTQTFEFVMDPRTRNRLGSDIHFTTQENNGLKRQLESPPPSDHQSKRQKWVEPGHGEESTESGQYTPYPTVKSEPESTGSPVSSAMIGLEGWIDRSVHDLVTSIKDRVQDTISQKLQDAWGEAE